MNYTTMGRGGSADGAELQRAVKARCDLIAAEFRAAKAAGNRALCDDLRGELERLKMVPERATWRRVRRGLAVHLSHPSVKRSAADDLAEVSGFLAVCGGQSKTPRRNATAAGDARLVAATLARMTGASRPAARRAESDDAFCDRLENEYGVY